MSGITLRQLRRYVVGRQGYVTRPRRGTADDVVDTVGRDASGVLLDPDVSVAEIVERGALARDVGLLVRIEADGFDTLGGLRRSRRTVRRQGPWQQAK